jgi:phosphoglycolate phosphatase-like HAD superfamily hydrolase
LTKSSQRFSSYIFDLDGTLFHLPVDWRAVRHDVLKLTKTPAEGVSIFRIIKDYSTSRPGTKEELLSIVDAHEVPAAETTVPFDESPELLRFLSRKSKVGLVTMQGSKACGRVLERFGVTDCFNVVLTREDALDRAEQLGMACDSLGSKSSETFFCGDKKGDLDAGRSLGMTVALVGRRAREDWGPDYLFPEFGQLRSFLESLE